MHCDQSGPSRFVAEAGSARHQLELSRRFDRERHYSASGNVGNVDEFAVGPERDAQWLLQTTAAKRLQRLECASRAVDRVFRDRAVIVFPVIVFAAAVFAVAVLAGVGDVYEVAVWAYCDLL